MLRGETEEVQRRVRQAIADRDGAEEGRETFSVLRYHLRRDAGAQDALRELLNVQMDLLLVVGGYNSSNTSHLAEMGEERLPTYFVLNASRLVSPRKSSTTICTKTGSDLARLVAGRTAVVGITAGASCPNNLIEETLIRLFELRGIPREQLDAAA